MSNRSKYRLFDGQHQAVALAEKLVDPTLREVPPEPTRWRIQTLETMPGAGQYLSLKLGRDWGCPTGAYTPDAKDATVFRTIEEAERAHAKLGHMQAMTKVSEVPT